MSSNKNEIYLLADKNWGNLWLHIQYLIKSQHLVIPYCYNSLLCIPDYQNVAFVWNGKDINLFRLKHYYLSLLLCLNCSLWPCNHLSLWPQGKKESIFIIILELPNLILMCRLFPSNIAIRIVMKHLTSGVSYYKPITNLHCWCDLLFITT